MARRTFGKSEHVEQYRIVSDEYWPRTPNSTHNARYFEHFDDARAAYIHLAMAQALEERVLERVTFECRNDLEGTYAPMFESRQYHALESYGLSANDADEQLPSAT